MIAALLTSIWCWVAAVFAGTGSEQVLATALLSESTAVSCWLLFLVRLWGTDQPGQKPAPVLYHLLLGSTIIVGLIVVVADLLVCLESSIIESPDLPHMLSQPALAVVGLALIVDTYRKARETSRLANGHLLAGFGFFFSLQLLTVFGERLFPLLTGPLWELRGLLLAALAPLVAVSVARNRDWSLDLIVSRTMVKLAIWFLGSAIYLVAVTAVSNYLRIFGGVWGEAAQVAFLIVALIAPLPILFSHQVRANVRVFVDKHFFSFRYDYRAEWLRLIETMSRSSSEDARVRSIRALAELLDSPGGGLWLRDSTGHLVCQANWGAHIFQATSISLEDDFARYLKQSAWIIDLDELAREPGRYAGLRVPPAITACPEAWLVIPLLFKEDLIGFVLLEHSSVRRHLNWEDHDLLKTIGQQLSGYLALKEASEELIEARQFEGFNRLTAYLVHDLKNVSAQLGLVISNARKHKDNRAFVDDAVRTIENAAGKMNRLLDSLRQGVEHSERRPRLVDLRPLLAAAVAEHRDKRPNPELLASEEGSVVSVDPERLKSVIGHLIQNAQEATSQDGFVRMGLTQDADFAVIEISDNGSGMDEDFVRNRLFRPFDTTKGSAGMGIGAYESREFVQATGGSIDVHSEPEKGTTITLRIPRAEQSGSSAPSAEQDGP